MHDLDFDGLSLYGQLEISVLSWELLDIGLMKFKEVGNKRVYGPGPLGGPNLG